MESTTNFTLNHKFVSLEDLKVCLKENEPVMFDTETDKLYGQIKLAQFYQKDSDYVFLVKSPNPNKLSKILDDYHLVIQNASYDITTVQKQTKTSWIPKHFSDVFLLARLKYFDKESFSLDNLGQYALGVDYYMLYGISKKDIQEYGFGDLLSHEQILYASLDVYILSKIYEKVFEFENNINYKLDLSALRHALKFQNNGLPVIESARETQVVKNEIIIEIEDLPINSNSYKQVRDYIGEETSNGLALALHTINGNEKAKKVNKVRKLLKSNNFLSKFKTNDGRIYGVFSPSARSGRFTCKNQNLQQIPRNMTHIFGFKPTDGKVLVYADFSQLELRCVCAVIGERKMEQLFRDNADIHSYTRSILFGNTEDKSLFDKQRQIAKTANFNLLYGGSARMLGDILIKNSGIFLQEKELHKIKSKWKSIFPDISSWQEKAVNDWSAGAYNQTPMGRKYVGKLMTDHINLQIQGAGAEVAKIALCYLLDSNPNIQLCNFKHDDFVLECEDNPQKYKIAVYALGKAMKDAWTNCSRNYFKIKDLPNPVTVGVGYNLADVGSLYSKDF